MPDRSDPKLTKAARHARIGIYRLLLSQRAVYRALRNSVSPNLLLATDDEPTQAESASEFGLSATVVAYFADSPGAPIRSASGCRSSSASTNSTRCCS